MQHRLMLTMWLMLMWGVVAGQAFEPLQIPFAVGNDTLLYPLAGGLNNPQFSSADLNNNGLDDLVVFDRRGNVLLTFLKTGEPGAAEYVHAPEFQKNFPPMRNWMVMVDFDGNGIVDIFSYSNIPGVPGVVVHRGYYNDDDELSFEQINFGWPDFQLLKFPDFNNIPTLLYVSNEDIPAFVDVDGDGDLDILTFNFAGGYVEYYRNYSVELGYGTDTLIYKLEDDCWGRFYESGISPELDLSPSVDSCMFRQNLPPESGIADVRHAGSTLLAFDASGNGLTDLLLGDITFSNMVMVYNTGTPQVAYMTSQDVSFPSNDVPVNLPVFPAGFYLDVDQDGKKDLIVAPNQVNASENYHVAWYYRNVSNNNVPEFELQQTDFLVDGMIDLGTGAYPIAGDFTGNGLPDLLIGNRGYYNPMGLPHSRLQLFENTGTEDEPFFTLTDDDYLGMSAYGLIWLVPAWGDLTGNGVNDLIVGDENGRLTFYRNLALPGEAPQFASPEFNFEGILVGKAATPVVVDLDLNGTMDLIVGSRLGNLSYYKNNPVEGNPQFTLINNALGGVDTRPLGSALLGYSTPSVFYQNGTLQIVSGGYGHQLYHYNGVEGNLGGNFNKVTEFLGNIAVGVESAPHFADLNHNGYLELIIGNARGGISIYSTPFVAEEAPSSSTSPGTTWEVFPNPARDRLYVTANGEDRLKYEIFGVNGQSLLKGSISSSDHIMLNGLIPGFYILRLSGPTHTYHHRFTIQP